MIGSTRISTSNSEINTSMSGSVKSKASSSSLLCRFVFLSTPFLPQNSLEPAMAEQAFNFEHQPLNAPIDSAQHIPGQCSPLHIPPSFVHPHNVYIPGATSSTAQQPISSSSQAQFVTPEVSQPNVSTKDQLSFDSSAYLKRVSVPRVSGNKKDVEGWKAAFMSCVDKAGAFLEYKLLHFRECLTVYIIPTVYTRKH